MYSIKSLPQVSVELINKLFVAKELYREISTKYSDLLMQDELKRLALEKKIFIKDLHSIKDFSISDHLNEHGDDIQMEKENLIIEINHLFLEQNEEDVVKFIMQREKKLIDLYYLLFREKVEDDFIRMILKNQLDETERSLKELSGIKSNLNA